MHNYFSKNVAVGRRKGRTYYMRPVNISYSFKTLESIAKEKGVKLEEGDILVVDNENGDKRKAFTKTKNGFAIIYASTHRKNAFLPLTEKNGWANELTEQPVLSHFSVEKKEN